MRAIYGFLVAVIGVYIGVSLLPGLNETIGTITTPTYDAGVAGMVDVIMIAVAAALIFMLLKGVDFGG